MLFLSLCGGLCGLCGLCGDLEFFAKGKGEKKERTRRKKKNLFLLSPPVEEIRCFE